MQLRERRVALDRRRRVGVVALDEMRVDDVRRGRRRDSSRVFTIPWIVSSTIVSRSTGLNSECEISASSE